MSIPGIRDRAVTSIVIGASVIGLTALGEVAASLLVVLIVFLCALELWKMYVPTSPNQSAYGFGMIAIVPLLATLSAILIDRPGLDMSLGYYLLPSIPVMVFVAGLSGRVQQTGRLEAAAIASALIALPGIIAIEIVQISSQVLLAIFILLWVNDVFAYLVGSLLGRRKIAPSISPGKSWEGAIGGAILTIAASTGLVFLNCELVMREWLIIALLVVLFGTLGDLAQSSIKRLRGVKDSGNSLPGHGGIWDRFDSFLGCIPWIGIYLLFFA